jgi:hypothetical protein
MLLRLVYLGITNAFALLRWLPGDGRDKDIEILSLRTSSQCCSANPDPDQQAQALTGLAGDADQAVARSLIVCRAGHRAVDDPAKGGGLARHQRPVRLRGQVHPSSAGATYRCPVMDCYPVHHHLRIHTSSSEFRRLDRCETNRAASQNAPRLGFIEP